MSQAVFEIIEKSIDVGGVKIAYTVCGEEDARPVFLVHGLLSNGRDYDFLVRAMAEKGYRAIAMDLPGRGKSDWLDDPKKYNPRAYIPYCLALIQKEIGARGFDWFGVSLGGMLGMGVAAYGAAKIERLILVDIGPEIPAKAVNVIADYAGASTVFDTKEEAEAFLRMRCAGWGISSAHVWAHLFAHDIVQTPEGLYRLHYDPAISKKMRKRFWRMAFWGIWKKVRCPVLLIHGGKSLILPLRIVEKMQKLYKGPKMDVLTFPDCGHVPGLMEDAQIDIFLNQGFF